MPLLTPIQIGALAAHIQEAVTKYPEPLIDYSRPVAVTAEDVLSEMADWEKHLKAALDADTTLPNYSSFMYDSAKPDEYAEALYSLLETLIDYYTTELVFEGSDDEDDSSPTLSP